MDQATKIRPTIPAMVEPTVAPLVEGPATLGPVATLWVGPVATAVGKVATLAKKCPPLKKKSIIVVEKEVRPFLSTISFLGDPFSV